MCIRIGPRYSNSWKHVLISKGKMAMSRQSCHLQIIVSAFSEFWGGGGFAGEPFCFLTLKQESMEWWRNNLKQTIFFCKIMWLSCVSRNDVRTSDRARAIAMVTSLSKVKRHFSTFSCCFHMFMSKIEYRTTSRPTWNFAWRIIIVWSAYHQSLVLVEGWCGSENYETVFISVDRI